MVFKSEGAVVFGDLTAINSNKKTFKIGNANVDPSMVQPTVKDPRFAKISDWRNWLLASRQAGGFTRSRRTRIKKTKKRGAKHRRTYRLPVFKY
jgi:hypothetical protein